MASSNKNTSAPYIAPLNMNGLQGRMLRLPTPAGKNREILFIYGHHSNIEHWDVLIKELNQFGAVTAPDMPGFGGMQSLYRIGQKPTLDALADYLAAFVKLRYKRRRLTIVAVGFGFVVATRMLQRYPDIARKTDMVVSIMGFAHHDDFTLSYSRQVWYRIGSRIMSWYLPALLLRYTVLQSFILKQYYMRTPAAQTQLPTKHAQSLSDAIEAEVKLWQQNDVRTYMMANRAMLGVDNCQVPIDLPVWHIDVGGDHNFDAQLVEQHFKVIFSDFHHAKSQITISQILAQDDSPRLLLPRKLRRVLARG